MREGSRGRGSGGLLTSISPELQPQILFEDRWWIFSRITQPGWSVIIYLHQSGSGIFASVLQPLQTILEDLAKRFPEDCIVLGGDFNAHLGALDSAPTEAIELATLMPTRKAHDQVIKQRGRCLLDFMNFNGFTLINGRAPSDYP